MKEGVKDIYKMAKSRERETRDIKLNALRDKATPNKRRRDQEQMAGVFQH
jgi:hypothetical protein